MMIEREQVSALLPYLRRLARAATGSSNLGDEAVARALGRLMDEANNATSSARQTAFGLVCRELRGTPQIDPAGLVVRDDQLVQRRIASLSIDDRLMLLLTTVESFAPDVAAELVGHEREDGEALLARARERLCAQEPVRVLIIEDEPMIAMDLSSILSSRGHQVLDVARTRAEARQKALSLRPELVLADIRLADDSSGLDAVADITRELGDVPVVFITAFPERLLKGRREEPAFMVTKPFDEEMVALAIAQAQASSPLLDDVA